MVRLVSSSMAVPGSSVGATPRPAAASSWAITMSPTWVATT